MKKSNNIKPQRNSFIFYASFRDALQDAPDDVRLTCYDAIVDYALYGKTPQLTGWAKSVFLLTKPQLDANTQRYINGCKGGEFGKMGGAPIGNDNAVKTTPKQPQNNP